MATDQTSDALSPSRETGRKSPRADHARCARATCGLALLTLCVISTSGCLSPTGLLYTHATAPYFLPTDQVVHRGTRSCTVDVAQIKEPLTRANISVIWTSRAVAEASERAGISELRYVDLQTFSFLNGIYTRRRLVFYGE